MVSEQLSVVLGAAEGLDPLGWNASRIARLWGICP